MSGVGRRTERPRGPVHTRPMHVTDIMTSDPVCCTPDTTIAEAACLMTATDCGELPVVQDRENRRLVGVITDRDIVCRVVAEAMDPVTTSVGAAMTGSVVTCRPDSDVAACVDLMEAHQVRRIPVVDDAGCCCGIVSQADIALNAQTGTTASLLRDVSRP